jgi:hypothetical protein
MRELNREEVHAVHGGLSEAKAVSIGADTFVMPGTGVGGLATGTTYNQSGSGNYYGDSSDPIGNLI